MKKKYYVKTPHGTKIEMEYSYIPARYVLAILLTVLEVLAIIGIVIALCAWVPYFYLAALATQICCVIKIIATDENPDYKIPWLLFVLILPVAGFMLYFIFSSRTLRKKYVKRLKDLKAMDYKKNDNTLFKELETDNLTAARQAKMLCKIADTHLFKGATLEYFALGEDMFKRMLVDLKNAKKFIYLEYFIVEEGKFWNSILDILKQKAESGVDVKVIYDDIGCMSTLPGNYNKILQSYKIDATPFSRLKGNADSEFNNRNHRKICSIDGVIGYTGGVNIADEYINETVRFGHWKDTALRIEGDAVWELTKLFVCDFGINKKDLPKFYEQLYPENNNESNGGYIIPFGDGPKPLYNRRVGKSVIMNMLNTATDYAHIMTPYLIIDNELCECIESAALRGVKVKIIIPHIPDKKMIFGMTQSFAARLMKSGVEIFEYESGFVHAKNYIVDGKFAMTGTINLDYRSLVHHFENGVWLYDCPTIRDMENDFELTIKKCIKIEKYKFSLPKKILHSFLRIFAPLL